MDRAAPEEGRKRRLPVWMLGVTAADKVSKSLNGDINDDITGEDVGIVRQCRKPKSKARTARREKEVRLPDKEVSEVEESSLPENSGTKRRKRDVCGQDANCDGNVQECGIEKRKRDGVGRRVGESAPGKKQKTKSFGFESSDEIGAPSPGEDDEDPTMEDLLSIAKEVTQCYQPKSKARNARREKEVRSPDKKVSDVEESSFLVKCGSKRRKREVGGVGRKLRECACSKERKAKSSGFESSEEIEAPSPGEDDEDLTMEDLMSIAKEFVKDDNELSHQQLANVDHKEESQFANIAVSRCETGGSPLAPQSIMRSSTHEETSYSHNSAENMTKIVTEKLSMTGDPTQDMLDLFLGPLLKKPHGEGKKVNLVTEDIIFAYEVKKQDQNVVIGNQLVPLTKKKSSLKDKVAMFLD